MTQQALPIQTIHPKRRVYGYFHLGDTGELLGATYHVLIINYIADTLCYDALDAIEQDKKVYRFKVKKQIQDIRNLIRQYEVKEDDFLSRKYNIKFCSFSDHIHEQLQNLIDKLGEAVREAIGEHPKQELFTTLVIALMMEQFASYNIQDRIEEFHKNCPAIVLLGTWASHMEIFKKVNTLTDMLQIPDISKNMKLTSRFVRLQKQLFDDQWLCQCIDETLESIKQSS